MVLNIKVLKKDGTFMQWKPTKIRKAILAASASGEVENPINEAQINEIINSIEKKLIASEEVDTYGLHEMVIKELYKVNKEVYANYKAYREYRKRYANTFKEIYETSSKIISFGDKENANKDSTLNSTKHTLIAEDSMKKLMVNFEMPREWIEAHNQGWIYIHDLSSRYLQQINCCLFDMGNVLKNGFELNGIAYYECKTIQAAMNVGSDVILSASANQYGGFTVPEFDKVMGPYVEKTYNKYYDFYMNELLDKKLADKLAMERTEEQLRQGYQGFETKLNTITSALGQIPFVTITLGLGTDKWSRMVSKCVFKTREDGLGKNKITAVFPKIVFLHRDEINGNEKSPNFDLKLIGIECSKRRMYPDWLSLDNGNLGEVFDRCGKAVSPMGCRAYLSPFIDQSTGEEIYVGRNNIGAVTLGLIKMAIESKGNLEKFREYIDTYSQMIFDIHEWTYERIGKAKGSTNPLLFVEGGSWMSVGYDDPIEPILKASTASLGFLGLEETCQTLFGSGIMENHDFALDIVKYLKKLTEDATKKYDHLYALYATPAEGLIYKTQLLNREKYGIIPNVTDRDYCTNSFHIPVWQEITAPEKMIYEKDFHKYSTGGRIAYNEFPNGTDANVLQSLIDYSMKNGLYYGVNIVSSTCNSCNHEGDFEICPICNSEDVTSVTRACGYLSYDRIKGDTRYNKGKQDEIHERVKHIKR